MAMARGFCNRPSAMPSPPPHRLEPPDAAPVVVATGQQDETSDQQQAFHGPIMNHSAAGTRQRAVPSALDTAVTATRRGRPLKSRSRLRLNFNN